MILQVIQRHNQPEKRRNKGTNVQFFLPQILVLIFKFMSNYEDANSRIKILEDLLELLDSNTSNIEALMVRGSKSIILTTFLLQILR